MPFGYQLLFTDVDNTLLPAGGHISDRDLAFIRNLLKEGVRVVIASGRCRDLVWPVICTLGLDRMHDSLTISQNGGHIFRNDTRQTISLSPTDPKLIARLFVHARELGIRSRSYSENLVYFNRTDPAIEDFRRRYQCHCRLLTDPASEITEPPVKFMVIDPDPERIRRFYLDTLPLTEGRLRADFSSPTTLEYTECEVCKGAGLKRVCEYYNISPAKAVAIGDSENDMTMIREAGLGIAMHDAFSPLKSKADRVSRLSCAEGGFSDTLKDIWPQAGK